MALFDFLKEIPKSTQSVINFVKDLGQSVVSGLKQGVSYQPSEELKSFMKGEKLPEFYKPSDTALNIAKDIFQGVARSGGSVGLTLMGKKEFTTEEIAQVSPALAKFKDILYGKDPIKSLETRIAEAKPKVEEFGKKYGIEPIEKGALPLSIVGVLGFTALDFTGWGGGEKQAVKLLAKTSKVEEVMNILKKIKVSDELIENSAKVISKLTKEEDIVKELARINKLQKATKTLPEAQKGVSEALKAEKGILPKERQFLQSVSQSRPDIPVKIGGQYIPRSTDELAIKAKNLIKTDINTAETLAKTGTDEKAVATASELIKHYSDEAIKTTNQATKNALYDKASEIAHITAENLTEQGRAVQAASIMGRLTPEGMLRFAAKEINKYNEAVENAKIFRGKKISQLTAEQTKNILDEYKRIEKMADGTQKAMAFKQLTDSIADLIPSSMFQKIISVWKAGLLTGIKTSGLNTFSNLFHGTSEIIKDIPAIAVDSVMSLFTKKRTVALAFKGTFGGTKEGFEKGWRYLKTGFDERNVGIKLDWKRVNFGKGKVAKSIQGYEETIFHLMGAEDQPFYYGAKARSLASQAKAQTINNKLKGKEAEKFIDNLIQNPTDKMIKNAVSDAEIAVFQNPTLLGKVAKAIQKTGVGEVIVPFGRTPSAVAMQLVNYTPVGIVSEIGKQVVAGKFNQRLFSQAMGRGITGSAVLWIGSELAKKGLINTDYPTTEKEQKLWETEGRTSNSIKLGNKYRNVNVLGPAGMVLIVGAKFQQSLEKTGSIIESLTEAMAGGAKSLTEQTFLRGVNQVIEALNDPSKFFSGWFSNTMASIIPTIIKDVGVATDLKKRRAEGLLGPLISRIPFARKTLEPKIGVLGQEIKEGGNWLETMIDPSRPSKEINSEVANELRRLWNFGLKVSPTLLGDKKGYEGLTPEENTMIWKKVGELINSKLNNLIKLEQYKNLSNEEKAKIAEDIIDKAKLMARVQAVMDLTEDLSGQELKDKLSELKKGGLMTKEVFNKFIELK